MNRDPRTIFLGWLLLSVALTAIAWVWMFPELAPDGRAAASWKLLTTMLLIGGLAALIRHREVKGWRDSARILEAFALSLPGSPSALPERQPELESVTRALRGMAERVRDLVERANLEAARREAILACMTEGVLAVDGEMRVILCNQAFASAFSVRPVPDERMLYEVVREPALREILERVVNSGSPEHQRLRLPTAGNRWFETRALPLAGSPGRGALMVLHDITDIQNQEQLRKDFVADVSHELRTPLAAIRGYAETLLDGALEDRENNRRFVEIILSHAIRLNNITSDLLILSEIDAEVEKPLPAERISMLEVIESAMNSVQNAASFRKVKLRREDCTDCFVMGQRFRLEQVVSNLLDNAVKFNRPEGEVHIECGTVDPDRVRLSVSDTGVGIPQSDLKRIFERFYRVDKARARSTGGTGLGLPIVREVVQRMGGSVSVESQLGKGSKFTILLERATQ